MNFKKMQLAILIEIRAPQNRYFISLRFIIWPNDVCVLPIFVIPRVVWELTNTWLDSRCVLVVVMY